MLDLNFSYAQCVATSERVNWRLDDVMPLDAKVDLTRPLLPAALAAQGDLSWLSDNERLVLNHLASNAYLNLFQFVEEFILCTVVEHAQGELFGDHENIRALVRFADEEIKHQQLFKRFRGAFDRAFGRQHKVLDNAGEVAEIVLSKSPIGVMLVILHIELMTQDHYTQSVKGNDQIDPFFALLLEKHWVEESQHARIDALELDKLASVASPEAIEQGFRDYLDLLGAFDGLLAAQAKMDLEAFTGRDGPRALRRRGDAPRDRTARGLPPHVPRRGPSQPAVRPLDGDDAPCEHGRPRVVRRSVECVSGILDRMPEGVRSKLVNMFGQVKAEQLARELMMETGVTSLDPPDNQLRFGDALIRRGGVLAAIGRSVRVQAFLAGAREV